MERALTEQEVSAEGMTDFLIVAKDLARKISNSCKGGRKAKIDTSIAADESLNAWAISNGTIGGPHHVIISKGLISGVQSLCGQIAPMMTKYSTDDEWVRKNCPHWKELPHDQAHYSIFAQMLALGACVFVVNHELAHIALGHVGVQTMNDSVDTVGVVVIDEAVVHSAVVGDGRAKSSNLVSQAKEADADTHALIWTKHYLQKTQEAEDRLKAFGPEAWSVWKDLAGSPEGLRFVLIVSAWVIFFLLGPGRVTPDAMAAKSHPPTVARMLTSLRVERWLSGDPSGAFADKLTDDPAILFSASLIAHTLNTGTTAGIDTSGLTRAKIGTMPPVRDVDALRAAGLFHGDAEMQEIGEHYDKLRQIRREISERLSRYRILSKEAEVPWYR